MPMVSFHSHTGSYSPSFGGEIETFSLFMQINGLQTAVFLNWGHFNYHLQSYLTYVVNYVKWLQRVMGPWEPFHSPATMWKTFPTITCFEWLKDIFLLCDLLMRAQGQIPLIAAVTWEHMQAHSHVHLHKSSDMFENVQLTLFLFA